MDIKEWREKNKAKVKAYQKKYAEKNKEQIRRYKKEYFQKNKQRIARRNRERWKVYYHNNKEKILEKGYRYRKNKRDNLINLKKGKSCSECGWNKHIEILQFHHLEPNNKKGYISRIKRKDLFEEEIKKCVLLCPNCHYWKHFNASLLPNR